MGETVDIGHKRRSREALNTQDATKWTPRDALQDALADLDAGKLEGIDMVQITYRRKIDGKDRFGYYSAGVDRLQAMGLLLEGLNISMEGSGQ